MIRLLNWYSIMVVASLGGAAVYYTNPEVGSYLMGVGAGIGIFLSYPILQELILLSLPESE